MLLLGDKYFETNKITLTKDKPFWTSMISDKIFLSIFDFEFKNNKI